MPRKATEDAICDAVTAYCAGQSLEHAAHRHHMVPRTLRKRLMDQGLWRSIEDRYRLVVAHGAGKRRWTPPDDLADRYLAGASVKSLSEEHRIAQNAVRDALKRAGVPIRGYQQANELVAVNKTPEQHRAGVQAAHAAWRETELEQILTGLGLVCRPQHPIGPYNIDIAVEPVAVEILATGWLKPADWWRQRAGYLFDAGWNLLVVRIDKTPLTPCVGEYIRSFVEQSRRDPSFRREKRVIRGDGQVVTARSQQLYDLAPVPPASC